MLIPTRRNAAHKGRTAEVWLTFCWSDTALITEHHGVERYFCVEHHAWEAEELDWIRLETGLLEKTFPWFTHGKLSAAIARLGSRTCS